MRFAHTNIVADDWRKLADFYIAVFGCREKPPQRSQSGEWLARATGVPDAELEGVHLLLPGHGETGPTLEIFSYRRMEPLPPGPANRQGFGHIAFEVADVESVTVRLEEHGGERVGERTRRLIDGAGWIEFLYARDPEGNLVEIQHWEHPQA